jgi:hypothetical protein
MMYVMQECSREGSTCFRLSHVDPDGGADTADYIVPNLRRSDLLEECLRDDEEREVSQFFLYEVPNLVPEGYFLQRGA